MDIAMPNLNGLEATRQIAKEVPTAKLLVLSSYNDDEYVHQITAPAPPAIYSNKPPRPS